MRSLKCKGPLTPHERVLRLFKDCDDLGLDNPTTQMIEDVINDAEFDTLNWFEKVAERHGRSTLSGGTSNNVVTASRIAHQLKESLFTELQIAEHRGLLLGDRDVQKRGKDHEKPEEV